MHLLIGSIIDLITNLRELYCLSTLYIDTLKPPFCSYYSKLFHTNLATMIIDWLWYCLYLLLRIVTCIKLIDVWMTVHVTVASMYYEFLINSTNEISHQISFSDSRLTLNTKNYTFLKFTTQRYYVLISSVGSRYQSHQMVKELCQTWKEISNNLLVELTILV